MGGSLLTRGYLICFTGTVIWSATGVLIRYLTESHAMPPILLAFWRDLLVSLALLTVFLAFKPGLLRIGWQDAPFLAAYGLALASFNSLWTISVSLNGAGASTVLAYSSTAFTAVLGWRLFAERLDGPKLLAVTLSLAGCGLVAGAFDPASWRVNLLGVLTGLSSGVGFAAYSLFGKAASIRRINSWTALLYTFAWAAIFLFAFNLLPWLHSAGLASQRLLWLGGSLPGWLALLGLAFGPTIGGYGLYTLSMHYLPASVANLIATLEPSMTAMLAYFFLAETLSGPQLLGSLLIVTGVVILRLYEGRLTIPAAA
jgi:drug/metabolite transporter (DMT)-like permease